MVNNLNKRLRTVLLLTVLLLATLTLSGCSIPRGEIDINAPQGAWNAIVYFIAKLLIAMHQAIAGAGIPYSYGWAIILLTVFLKVVTLPLTLSQLRSTRATQELQPKIKELQEKYGKDRQKLSEEQMKLYKEAGVNPMGGCLPLLVQLPILWALYQSLYVLANPSVHELQNAGFYWIKDLSFPDLTTGSSWVKASFNAGDWGMLFMYLSLPIIMIVSQLVLQKMTQPAKGPKGSADPQSQMMGQTMMLMPIVFGFITVGLPSGLTLYWTVSNLLSIVQQYFVTGWGGLVEWIPALKRDAPNPYLPMGKDEVKSAPLPIKSVTEIPPTTGGVPATTDQPTRPIIKRRNKRRK